MTKFWKNTGILAFAEILLKAKALIMMPFITKHFGTMDYGVWSQVSVIISLLAPLIFLGMDNSLTRFLPGKKIHEQKKIFTGWMIFGSLSGLLTSILTIIMHEKISILFFSDCNICVKFIILASLNIVVTGIFSGIRCWFRIQNEAVKLVALTIIQNIIQLICLLCILMNNMGIYELIKYSLIVDSLLLIFYLAYFFYKTILVTPSFAWLKSYLKFGLVFLPSGYAIWILNSVDRIFLAQYHNLESIGIYAMGFTIGYTIIQIIVNPIWSLFSPQAAALINNNKINELNTLFNQSIKLILWIVLPSIAGFLIIGKDVMLFLSTKEFANGYLVVPIILYAYTCSMLSSYFETILILKNKPALSTIFTVIACVVNLILNIILIPRYSYIGAAIATASSFLLQLFLSMMFAFKENLIKIHTKPLLKIGYATLAMFFITKVGRIYLTNNHYGMINVLVIMFLGVCSYMLFTNFFKIYRFSSILNLRNNFEHV